MLQQKKSEWLFWSGAFYSSHKRIVIVVGTSDRHHQSSHLKHLQFLSTLQDVTNSITVFYLRNECEKLSLCLCLILSPSL